MDNFFQDLSILLVGAGLLSYLAVILRQPIIIAYIVGGMIAGPFGMTLIRDVHFIEGISHLGITLLLFLAGLNLQPSKLFEIFRKTTLVTFVNCVFSLAAAFLIATVFGFGFLESLCIGLAMMFSSTILVVKLLPTTQLHHAKMGASCIGVLILQDLLAVGVLAFIRCLNSENHVFMEFMALNLRLILFVTVLFLFERFILRRVMEHVERLHEVIFILSLGWCFGIAFVSDQMGLFYESGAFFAGVALARHPIALFIAENLKPLRDFFLVLFFFALGAKIDLFVIKDILFAAGVIAAVFIVVKPYVMQLTFEFTGESRKFAREASVRLGQLSEFSLLIALLALELNVISDRASQLIQLSAIITFIASSYLVVMKFPTPIGTTDKLIKN